MRKIVLSAGIAMAAVALAAGSAQAQYNFAKKANKFQATLIPSYAACVAPNDNTSGVLPLPACAPAVRQDTVCGYNVTDPLKPLGQGQLQAVVAGANDKLDIKLQVKLQGLEAACIGETFCITPAVRASSLACQSGNPGGCTVLEALTSPFPLSGPGCGVVDEKGKLQIKTTVDTVIGSDLIAAGNRLQLDLLRSGVRRTTGPSPVAANALSFSAGLIAP